MGGQNRKIPFLILFPGPIPERVLIQSLIRVPGSIINLPFPVLKINAAQHAVPVQKITQKEGDFHFPFLPAKTGGF